MKIIRKWKIIILWEIQKLAIKLKISIFQAIKSFIFFGNIHKFCHIHNEWQINENFNSIALHSKNDTL
jgi:hypothetical protein